jgi:three-Cys-motif partner protein
VLEPSLPNGDGPGEVDAFFVETADHSKVKTTIATKYFFTWARIIAAKTRSDRIGYIDLYAGPGRYIDGTKSTPLLVLEGAIADPNMRQMLVTYFNDGKPAHADSLENAIKALPGIETLKHKPGIDKTEVGPGIVTAFDKPIIPTFAFIDPYGYKGLSLGLVNAVIKDWACECLFFFNYNRINPGINNKMVRPHMEALFGAERLAKLQIDIQGRPSGEREVLVMTALTAALQDLGGRFVVPFRFKMDEKDRTSHYLVFVSKNFLGYEIMRGVMGKASSSFINGVPSFEYNPSPPLFFSDERTVDALAEMLAVDLAGKQLTVDQAFEFHSPGKLYIRKNYKDAVIRLEKDNRVIASRPSSERKKGTLADDITISFPRLRAGARMESRSTPDRREDDRPPSVFSRPTA